MSKNKGLTDSQIADIEAARASGYCTDREIQQMAQELYDSNNSR